MRREAALVTAALLSGSSLLAQTRGAQLVNQPKPAYPENLAKAMRQGNVVLIGRVDTSGKVQDTRLLTTSHPDFVEPAMKAVREWRFRPALRDGKPITIAANIALRFRQESKHRGMIARPTLGDLAIFPATDAGTATAPEGFPIHAGADPRLRAEAVLDVTPSEKPHSYPVKAQAISPGGKRFTLYESSVNIPANTAEAKIPFSAKIGPDWEDGVWLVRFTVDGTDAGGGQFWLAKNPSTFDFVTALKNRTVN